MVDPMLQNSWIVPAAPFFACLIIVFGMMRTPLARYAWIVSILAIATSAVKAGMLLWTRFQHPEAPPYIESVTWLSVRGLELQMGVLVDNLSALMMFTVTFIAMLIQIYSTEYMEHELESDFARFFAYMSLFAASMLLLVVAPNFAQIYVGWELVGVCSYLLIGFWYFKKSAADACKKAFVVTRTGDMGFLLGILMLYFATNHLNFTGPDNPLATIFNGAHNGTFSEPLATCIAILIFCGAIGKSAQFPLHIWLPDAMEGPTPVSALIHAATMVAAGVYLVARCHPLFMATEGAALTVAYIGAITSFMAATMGIVSNDIKRVLAYSTCSQLGYMMMALGAGSLGLTAGMFHLTTHAFFKALMFLGAGSVIHAMHTNNMWQMGGLRKYMPVTALTFLAGCMAISGVPGLSGFFSKDMIFETALESHNIILIGAVVGVAAMTAFYMFRLYFVTFEGEYRGPNQGLPVEGTIEWNPEPAVVPADGHGDPHEAHGHEAAGHDARDPVANYYHHEAHAVEGTPKENPWMMVGPLVILAFFAVVAGYVQTPWSHPYFSDMVSTAVDFPYTVAHEAHAEAIPEGPNYGVMGLSIAAAGLGIVLAWMLFGRNPVETEQKMRQAFWYPFVAKKWHMDQFWTGLVEIFMFDLARLAAYIDRYVIDAIVRGVGWTTFKLGQLLREEHSGLVQQYVSIVLIGVLFFLVSMGFWEYGHIATGPVLGQ